MATQDSTYKVPLLDSKLLRLRYAWYYRIQDLVAALGMPQPVLLDFKCGTLQVVLPTLKFRRTGCSVLSAVRSLLGPEGL